MQTDPNLMRQLFDAAPEGVMLCDARQPEYPVVYVNLAMEILTGYRVEEIVGKNPRFLYKAEGEQEGLTCLRSALREGQGCHVVLRNVRADGTIFFNDITLVPLRDSNGELTHFASFHREGVGQLRPEPTAIDSEVIDADTGDANAGDTDTGDADIGDEKARGEKVGDKKTGDKKSADKQLGDKKIVGKKSHDKDVGTAALSTQTMMAYVRDDKLTGLLRRSYFEDLLQRDWGLAQRESRRLTLIAFDLDFFGQYRDVFGRQGADQCFRRIARVVAGCFRRATDMCARLDEDQVIALTVGMEEADATKFAETILSRVRDLAIHHPRSSISRYVTVSAGIGSMIPGPDAHKDQLIGATLGALRRSKDLGRNRVVCAT